METVRIFKQLEGGFYLLKLEFFDELEFVVVDFETLSKRYPSLSV
jgi:hypothetical protein